MGGPSDISLEWWPDYGQTLLWRGAERVSMVELGVSDELQQALETWLPEYEDELLFGETPRSAFWLADGTRLLRALQDELRGRYTVLPSDDFWLAGDT